MDFKDKVAIVTGGGNGIGRATALRFAACGARVMVVDRDEAGAIETARLVREAGGSASSRAADVTRSDDVRGFVEEAVRAYGQIDCLFNNAGIEGALAPIHEISESVFDGVIAVNVKGAFLCLRHILPVMVAQRSGAVVNTSSTGGLQGVPNLAPYSTSKHAVLGLTRSAAADVAAYGVRVNAVCPGPIRTRMIASINEQRQRLSPASPATPTDDYGAPEDIANLVLFLCSDLAANITGADFTSDGGRTAYSGAARLPRGG